MSEELLNSIVELALLSVVGLAPFATSLTALLKKLELFKSIETKTLSTIVIIGVYVIALVADEFGYIEQFGFTFEAVAVVVTSLASVFIGSSALYQGAKLTKTPILGDSRPDFTVARKQDQ